MSYFPLLIQYTDGKKCTVQRPMDIESGRAFKVLKTNYKE